MIRNNLVFCQVDWGFNREKERKTVVAMRKMHWCGFPSFLQLIPQSTDTLYLLNTFTYGRIVPSMKFIHLVCFWSSCLKSHMIFLHMNLNLFHSWSCEWTYRIWSSRNWADNCERQRPLWLVRQDFIFLYMYILYQINKSI